ncbi:pentapeptide repeats family protein, partial [Escherichia coli 96.0932]
NDSAARWNNTY